MIDASGHSNRQKSVFLAVRWNGEHVGDLSLDRSGAMHFQYSAQWLTNSQTPPISITIPKRNEEFSDRECKPFFEGLLPEEWQREAAARALGISAGNPFRLLEHLGGDVAGALTLEPQSGEVGSSPDTDLFAPLDERELVELMLHFERVPMLAGQGIARYSLAGAQSKIPVVLVEGRIALAVPGQASTHILKPEPARFPGLAANEAFCLTLAKSIGLDVAEIEWRSVGGKPLVLVSRFDRIVKDGLARRLHQEDFAQALGVPPSKKYATDGGPVFRDCFTLIRRGTNDPETERLKLVDAAIFNLVIGNADAHAKNFSLLHREDENVVFAPLYDLVTTLAWPELSSRFAMKYGGARTLEDISAGSFERFAADAGIDFEIVRARGLYLCDRVIDGIGDGIKVSGLSDLSFPTNQPTLIQNRAERVSLKLIS